MIAFVGGKIGEHLQRQPAKRLFPRWALAIQEENHWHFKFDIEYKFTFMLFKVMAHFRSNEAALSFLFFSSKFIYDLCLNQHSNSQNCTVLVKVWWSMKKAFYQLFKKSPQNVSPHLILQLISKALQCKFDLSLIVLLGLFKGTESILNIEFM